MQYGAKMSSIFVQIASYHDYELPRTIMDAMDKSSGENQINFGVSHCYSISNNIELPDFNNVKYKISCAPDNIGLGVGRSIAHDFYNGEDYYFQIDSHSRFDQDWDSKLISYVKKYQDMGFKKPLITTYPKVYFYENERIKKMDVGFVNKMSFSDADGLFKETLIPHQYAEANTDNNVFAKSISGGSIFTVGDFIKPNPDIAFYGEEVFIAARAYTNGFDLLLPDKPFMYHLYYKYDDLIGSMRRQVWFDFPKEFTAIDKISKQIIFDTFKENKVGEGLLGEERSLRDFEIHTGLDFTNGIINENC